VPDPGSQVYAVVERPRRIWAIAAINGALGPLVGLHDELAKRYSAGDRIVYLGNYFGPGPDGPAVLDELVAFRRLLLTAPGAEPWDVVYLRGTHEEMWQKLMQLQFAANPQEVLDWMLKQGVGAPLVAYGLDLDEARRRCREGPLSLTRWTGRVASAMHGRAGHDELFGAIRRYASTGPGGVLFVHAGLDPSRPLSEQGDAFWWGGAYFDAMESPYDGYRRVVRGADRHKRGRRETAATLSLDGGAGAGGPLIAAALDGDGGVLDVIAI
jgi:serine/threonine protein phosphatase 1